MDLSKARTTRSSPGSCPPAPSAYLAAPPLQVADIPEVDLSKVGTTKFGSFEVEVVDYTSEYFATLKVGEGPRPCWLIVELQSAAARPRLSLHRSLPSPSLTFASFATPPPRFNLCPSRRCSTSPPCASSCPAPTFPWSLTPCTPSPAPTPPPCLCPSWAASR